jgi:hypothetical protein
MPQYEKKTSLEFETYHHHAVHIVDITVLISTVVQTIFRHSDFRPVKNRWLIHIVPRVYVQGRT